MHSPVPFLLEVQTGVCCQTFLPDYIAETRAANGVSGGMAEWLKAHAWKACIRETVSWVRIPLPPLS
jgi:hypothetical protein